MITLETKMKKVEKLLKSQSLAENAMPAFADLMQLSIEDLRKKLINCENTMNAFYKFCVATAVGLVEEKAAQYA